MKQIVVMMAVVLVGCSKETPETSQAAEAKPQVASKPTPEPDPVSPADEKAISIADPIVEEAIRKKLKKPEGELTEADLEKVTRLDLAHKQLTDVPKGLEKLTQLKVLYLSGNQLTDVKGLEKLTKLTLLFLWGNQLTNVKGLEKLTQLYVLDLNSNQLTDVKGLEKLTQLKQLNLQGNPDLTKAQIDELQKALPSCGIYSNPKK